MLIPCVRTYPLKNAGPDLQAALMAIGLQAKNVANITCFIIRNVLASYQNGVLKENLTENQLRTLELANESVKKINDARERKHIKAIADGEDHKLNLLTHFGQTANPWQILNKTLLDNLARTHPNLGINPYTALPSVIARSAVFQTLDDFKSYAKAIKAYQKDPSKFTGRPKMPGYKGKNDQTAFQIPLTSTKRRLPKLGKEIASDYQGKTFLGAAEKIAYHGIDLRAEIKTIREKLGLPESSKPAVLRISFKKCNPQASIVFTYDQYVPDDSLIARVLTQTQLTQPNDNQKISATLKSMAAEQVGKFSFMDMGLNNFYSLAFSDSSSKNQILSNARLESKTKVFNQRYDQRLSELIPQELKELQQKESEQKLSQDEIIRKKQLFKIVYADQELRKIQAKRERWLKDALTKIAHGLVKSLGDTQLLIVGLNALWKQNADMGKTQNRRFHGTAHTQFLQILKHQCTKANIVLVTTEESYTSKSSFANNEPLKTHANIKQNKGNVIPESQPPPTPATGNPGNSGSRSKTNRHCFTNHPHPNSQFKNWKKKVHADINGAFNIARKMFSWFKMNDAIQFSYTLLWLSPKLGLTPMRF